MGAGGLHCARASRGQRAGPAREKGERSVLRGLGLDGEGKLLRTEITYSVFVAFEYTFQIRRHEPRENKINV